MQLGGALQHYPIPLPGVPSSPKRDLLEAFEAAAEPGQAPPRVPGAWLEALAAKLGTLRSRAERLASELAGTPDPDVLRGIGDLLLARYADVPRGMPKVSLPDFAGHAQQVELDPALSTHENATRYYQRAARAARARERLPALVEAARRETDALALLLERARTGAASAQEVERALPSGGPSRPAGIPALPYVRYRSSGGLEIRVGRGARQNDELTFQHSSPDDVWLHARHAAGAHVVLRWQKEATPPVKDLTEAAVLAALHSGARTSGSVPVDWTRRKYVRKPRKAAPGEVLTERTRTLFVEPDAQVEERLRARGDD
jgi:predicted ribosome quality control (RQC) complex YloA/Tae2 family protein